MACCGSCGSWPPSCLTMSCGPSVNTVTYAYAPQSDAFGRLRVSEPHTLFDSQQRFGADTRFVSNTALGGSTTYVLAQSSVYLTVAQTPGSNVFRESKYVFPYQPGKSLLVMATFCMAHKSSSNLIQRVGYFGTDNGIFLELSDKLYIVQRSNVTGTVVETKIQQSSWSYDALDSHGPSCYMLDITKTHIFWMDIEWLGVGNVRTGFVINGQFLVAHIFEHANYLTMAYMTTATLPVRYEIQNVTGNAPISNLVQICSTVISEGGYDQPFRLFSNIASVTRTMTAGTWYPVVSMCLAPGYLDAIVQVRQIDIVMTTNHTLQWALWSNVTTTSLTGESFVAHAQSTQVQIDQSATAFSTSGCYQIAAGIVNGTNQGRVPIATELSKYYSQIGRDSFAQTSEIFTLAVLSVDGVSGGGAGLQALLSWNELL